MKSLSKWRWCEVETMCGRSLKEGVMFVGLSSLSNGILSLPIPDCNINTTRLANKTDQRQYISVLSVVRISLIIADDILLAIHFQDRRLLPISRLLCSRTHYSYWYHLRSNIHILCDRRQQLPTLTESGEISLTFTCNNV
nr:uncharacterized protein LOC116770708 isoform X2 [Danaus plexippus plexippus]